MISGGRQEVSLTVQPLGTVVCIDGRQAGATPMTVRFTRRTHVVVFEREGYRTAVVNFIPQVNPWIALNFVPLLIIPGPLGLVVDIATGAVHELEPKEASFYLERADSTSRQTTRQPCSPY